MSSRHHIDDFMRGRIIGKIEEGGKITDVAREFDIAHSVVSRLWKSFKTTGMCRRRHGGGKQNSRKTVARRLRGGGLHARRLVVCVPLTRQHRTTCLQWCREHHNWTEQDWTCVLFSDENRFSLSSDCRHQLIWRESGTAYRPENIQEKDRYPTCSIMVWAGIMIDGRTRLHMVANGTMTGQRYIDEVLLPHDCLDSEGIQRLVWPARSPDLISIENVWDALGRQVAGRNYPPTNKNTLIRALTEEWDKLPQQLLDNVVQTTGSSLTQNYSRSQSEILGDLHNGNKRINPENRVGFGFRIIPEQYFSGVENINHFLENIDNNLAYYEIPAQLACACLKGHFKGRALDRFEVLGYRVIEDKATDYAHLKKALSEQFPMVRNRSELETRFYSSSQRRDQQPSDFIYELLKIHKVLELEMSEEKLIDHVVSD
ncbi:transposable element Tcb2 transposase [Trichonephila clavipes]|nr:transposable element Tcb2 transposase [Trichonephila clavipes]